MINESTHEMISKIVDSLGEMKGKVIFLSGAAGTGKTTLIKELGNKNTSQTKNKLVHKL